MRKYCCPDELKNSIANEPARHNEQNVAQFSSRGPSFDGRIKPDLLAPGEYIISAHSDGDPASFQCGTQAPQLANAAARLSNAGTSMATPTAAGLAALVQQYYREGFYPSGAKRAADAMKTPRYAFASLASGCLFC